LRKFEWKVEFSDEREDTRLAMKQGQGGREGEREREREKKVKSVDV
jgi:RNase H-fold protein (predicted Holliday junction resolvase)